VTWRPHHSEEGVEIETPRSRHPYSLLAVVRTRYFLLDEERAYYYNNLIICDIYIYTLPVMSIKTRHKKLSIYVLPTAAHFRSC
jgi:hypothetical protein